MSDDKPSDARADGPSPDPSGSPSSEPEVFIHPTSEVSNEASVGAGTAIWNWSRIREGAVVGRNVNIGQQVYIDSNVRIGDDCKIQNSVNLYDGLTVGDRVFIGPAVTFTNDLHPRATGDWDITPTTVHDGASIGANATIVCGVTLAAGCMIGAGSVVTKDVAPNTLVVGNPARPIAIIDEHGNRTAAADPAQDPS